MKNLFLEASKLISTICKSKKTNEQDIKSLEELLLHDEGWQEVSFKDKINLLKRLRPQNSQSPIRMVLHYSNEALMLKNMFSDIGTLSVEQKIHIYLAPNYSYSYDFDKNILESGEVTVDMLITLGYVEFAGRKLYKIPIAERAQLIQRYGDNKLVMQGYEQECSANDAEPSNGGYRRCPRL